MLFLQVHHKQRKQIKLREGKREGQNNPKEGQDTQLAISPKKILSQTWEKPCPQVQRNSQIHGYPRHQTRQKIMILILLLPTTLISYLTIISPIIFFLLIIKFIMSDLPIDSLRLRPKSSTSRNYKNIQLHACLDEAKLYQE